jgi:hypothetical protein
MPNPKPGKSGRKKSLGLHLAVEAISVRINRGSKY